MERSRWPHTSFAPPEFWAVDVSLCKSLQYGMLQGFFLGRKIIGSRLWLYIVFTPGEFTCNRLRPCTLIVSYRGRGGGENQLRIKGPKVLMSVGIFPRGKDQTLDGCPDVPNMHKLRRYRNSLLMTLQRGYIHLSGSAPVRLNSRKL